MTSLATVAALALTVTACSSEEKSPAGSGSGASAAPSASSSAAPSADASADPQENGSAAAGVGLEALANPIATVEAKTGMKDDPEGTVKVDLLGLKRKDKLLILTAAVTPTNSLAKPQPLFHVLGSHTWRPTLVDTKNLKQYSVVRSGGPLATSDLSAKAGSGQPMFVYAVFAAPPADVTTINVLFADTIPVLTDVPVQ